MMSTIKQVFLLNSFLDIFGTRKGWRIYLKKYWVEYAKEFKSLCGGFGDFRENNQENIRFLDQYLSELD